MALRFRDYGIVFKIFSKDLVMSDRVNLSERPDETIFPERIVIYANIWERAGAMIIDLLITLLVTILLTSTSLLPLSWVMVAWIYETLSLGSHSQATLGQRTMGIKVCNISGGKLDFTQATARFTGKFLSVAILFAGYIMALKNDNRQTLHDELADALVVTQESYQAAV